MRANVEVIDLNGEDSDEQVIAGALWIFDEDHKTHALHACNRDILSVGTLRRNATAASRPAK